MIIAYRAWLLGIRSGMLYSASAPNRRARTQRYCWETATATAVCNTAQRAPRPQLSNTLTGCYHDGEHRLGTKCGIYAYVAARETTFWADRGTASVWGVVGLWGEVHRHALGYRAEHARIIAIVDHPRIKVQAYPMVRRYPTARALLADWGQE